MKQSKTVTALCFLAVQGLSLVLVVSGAVQVGLDWKEPVALYWPQDMSYTGLVTWFEDTCRAFCTTELPGREKLTEANAAINRAAGKWIFESTSPQVVPLSDGHLSGVEHIYYYLDQSDKKVAELAEWTESTLGAPFLYVQAPCALCQYQEDQLPLPEMSNENAEASWLLRGLEKRGVDWLDLRESLHGDGLDHAGCFYYTDHHWTMETGLWAARTMAEELNERYGLGMDAAALAPEKFTDRTWERVFLGSWGRKVTLSFAQPEDFVLPVPEGECSFRLTVPAGGVDLTGGFDILYDEAAITPADLYTGNSYGAVLGGDCPYLVVQNLQNPDGPVLAVLRESFAVAPGPYLSMAAGQVHFIDARYYQGSVRELLERIRPDAVALLVNVQCHTGAYVDLVR